MSNYDLSILIPARNEMFLAKTVERLLEKIRGNTEIIIGLDGQWANPQVVDDPRVTIYYVPESIGQRAMTNQLCRLSKSKYVMKLDAHCEMDEGFDVKLLADMKDHWTVLPLMRNLHAFDWVCIGQNPKSGKLFLDPSKGEILPQGCGHRFYQGPTPSKCEKCGGNMERELKWIPKESPKSHSFRFDKTMHFQYWREYSKRPEVIAQGDLVETMSAQGSCFMITRERYWALDICDEAHGSWGQQGVEVAMKTWESGGQLICNKKTWYAHLFRTQGGDFNFPYPQNGRQVNKAKEYSRDIWMNDKWDNPLRIHDFAWVLQKFYPIPDWHNNSSVNIPDAANTEALESPSERSGISKGIIFYTDNQLNTKIAHIVQDQLRAMDIPIVSASLKPMPHFGNNIHIPRERGTETYFMQIIAALEASTADIIYFCEHDVLYHPSHFELIPSDKQLFYYNQNFWRVRKDGLAVHWDANQVSGLICNRDTALEYYKDRLEEVRNNGFNRSYEPGGRDPSKYHVLKSAYPNIDIRHGSNLTKSKWSPNDFRDKSTCVNWQEGRIETIPGWDTDSLFRLKSTLNVV